MKELEVYYAPRQVLFALSCFDNLVKNGRMSRVVGFVAGKMGMRIVGRGSDEGKLEMLHKTRGETRTLAFILEEMDRRGYQGTPGGHQPLLQRERRPAAAPRHRDQVAGADVTILPCSGLTSFYAQDGGIIVGY